VVSREKEAEKILKQNDRIIHKQRTWNVKTGVMPAVLEAAVTVKNHSKNT